MMRDHKALAMLRYLQWNTACGGTHCKVCFQFKQDGHAEDCELAALLAVPPPPEEPHTKTGGSE